MKTYMRIGLAGFVTAILFFFAVQSVYAETVIGLETYEQDQTWDKSGNPYILTSTVTISPGATLTIRDGVQIISSTTPGRSSGITVQGGKLFIKGKGVSRVSLKQVTNITVRDGYAEILNTDMQGGTGMSFTNSRARIATSTITDAVLGIKSQESVVSVEGSHIKGNSNGIRIVPSQIILVSNQRLPNTGGMGNAVDGSIPVVAPSFTVLNSSIVGNSSLGLGNFASYTVEARNNWWGNSGPLTSGANRVTGPVVVAPSLTEEPPLDPGVEEPVCCSSVLFIPGFQGTRLHSGGDKLWEPHNNMDVKGLYLDETGSSTDPQVYAGDAIDKAYGMVGVYGSFLNFLDRLVDEHTIDQWKVFGYDWRKPIAEVVAGTKRATTTESLIDTIEKLAAGSRTGKVTLVAHSNGGLVARFAIKTLIDLGKDSLVDKVISVAVPFLGTPEAILGLLHGDNQELIKGLVQESTTARTLGKNMPGVYTLLPSAEYFRKVFSPTIVFASSTIVDINDGSYPEMINTQSEQSAFLTDTHRVRLPAAESDIIHPLTGNDFLLRSAGVLHGVIDTFSWPSTIERFGILGWNTLTAQGIKYMERMRCTPVLFQPICKKVLSHIPLMSQMGDATVVSPSAADDTGTQVAMDLKYLSETDIKNLRHSVIMEASTTQSLVRNMLTHESHPDSFALPPGTAWGEPDYSEQRSFLAVSTHSPVELHVYDTRGNHTGSVAAPGEFENGFVTAYDEDIPGSTVRVMGEGEETERYVYLPDEGEMYSIVVEGTGMGMATVEVERFGGNAPEKVSFENIPVTPLTTLKTTVASGPVTAGASLASSTALLSRDVDGDDVVDGQVRAGAMYDPLIEITYLKKIVKTLLGDTKRAADIDKKLQKISVELAKGKKVQAVHTAEKLVNKMTHVQMGTISDDDREFIVRSIEDMIAQFE
jgi:pimeloyl-ACP methyl ester carboxylesterase